MSLFISTAHAAGEAAQQPSMVANLLMIAKGGDPCATQNEVKASRSDRVGYHGVLSGYEKGLQRCDFRPSVGTPLHHPP